MGNRYLRLFEVFVRVKISHTMLSELFSCSLVRQEVLLVRVITINTSCFRKVERQFSMISVNSVVAGQHGGSVQEKVCSGTDGRI